MHVALRERHQDAGLREGLGDAVAELAFEIFAAFERAPERRLEVQRAFAEVVKHDKRRRLLHHAVERARHFFEQALDFPGGRA